MEYRNLDVTLMSAEDIKDVSVFSKMDVYAVAYISGNPQSKKRTAVDKNSGTSPRWNQKFQFTVDERSLSYPAATLVIQLKAEKSFGGDRDIGEVAVPVSDLFAGNSGGAERVVEYQVRTPSGKPKGKIKFSYKFGEKFGDSKKAVVEEPVTAYPPPGYNKQGTGSQGMSAAVPAVAYPAPSHASGGYPGGHGHAPGYAYPPPPPPQAQGYYGAYPQPGGYPSHPGYGYPPAQGYYGYPQQPQQPKKKNGFGKMGLGIGAGLLGGMLLGDMVSDVGEVAAYNEGYEDAMGDVGDFDF